MVRMRILYLTSTIIIDTIPEIRQLVANIAHSENPEDPKPCNFLYFSEGDPTFYDFPKSQAGVFGPHEPPKINHPCTYIPSPNPNFNFGSNMTSNRPWLVVDGIYVPSD